MRNRPFKHWIALTVLVVFLSVQEGQGGQAGQEGELPGAAAQGYAELQAQRPELFDPVTGYRIARHRAPLPEDIPPPARRATVQEVRSALKGGAFAVDVRVVDAKLYDPVTGAWMSGPVESLPGAVWLAGTGWGRLEPEVSRYLEEGLARFAPDPSRPVVVFCVADCWMSWNAAQRIAALGYERVLWFAEGVDGWREAGGRLIPLVPEPVPVD